MSTDSEIPPMEAVATHPATSLHPFLRGLICSGHPSDISPWSLLQNLSLEYQLQRLFSTGEADNQQVGAAQWPPNDFMLAREEPASSNHFTNITAVHAAGSGPLFLVISTLYSGRSLAVSKHTDNISLPLLYGKYFN